IATPTLSTVTTDAAGVYTVTATAGGSACSSTSNTTVVVNTIAAAPANNGPVCVGGTVNLSSNESGTAPGVTYAWSGPLGYTSTDADPVLSLVTTDMAGDYTVTVSNSVLGCSATSSTTLTINTIAVVPTNDGPACPGGSVT